MYTLTQENQNGFALITKQVTDDFALEQPRRSGIIGIARMLISPSNNSNLEKMYLYACSFKLSMLIFGNLRTINRLKSSISYNFFVRVTKLI